MSKYVKKQNSSDPWLIDESNQTWTLGKNATITVTGEAAINIGAGHDNNAMILKGDLKASGEDSEGLRIIGHDTAVELWASSVVKAENGIYNAGTGTTIENSGKITGAERGIASDSDIEIVNRGKIAGDAAINVLGETIVTNNKNGVIKGEDFGVRVSTFSDAVIENYGKIVADGVAVHVNTAGNSYLTNEGVIIGDVQFGSGGDTINNVEGVIEGTVRGGLGNDNYYLGKAKTEIVENLDSGLDKVYSYNSHKLGDNFEDIFLLGYKTAKASGNALNNTVHGNHGDNVLRGRGGHDHVEGSSGDDVLIGGAGSDGFQFRKNYDRDVVADFDPNEDYLVILDLVDDFADLDPLISQHGDDTWLSFGGGDRLILKNVDADDVTDEVVQFSTVM